MLGILILALQVAAPREGDVKPLVLEFCSDQTTLSRAQELLSTLKQVDPILIQRSIVSVLNDEKDATKRAQRALRLAGVCRVPGLYKNVERFIGGDADQDAVIAAAADPAGLGPLYDRWMKLDVGSASFKYVDDALRNVRGVDMPFLSKLQGATVIADAEKKDRAALLLAHHLGSELTDRKAVLDAWPRLRNEFVADSKAFPLSGVDLLSSAEITGGRSVGRNVRVSGTGSIRVPLETKAQENPYVLKFRIYVRQPGLHIEAKNPKGEWRIDLKEKLWRLKTGDNRDLTVPAHWDWVTLSFVVRGTLQKEGDEWLERKDGLMIYVDDAVLLQNGQYSYSSEFLICSDGGDFVVSALELTHSDRKGK